MFFCCELYLEVETYCRASRDTCLTIVRTTVICTDIPMLFTTIAISKSLASCQGAQHQHSSELCLSPVLSDSIIGHLDIPPHSFALTATPYSPALPSRPSQLLSPPLGLLTLPSVNFVCVLSVRTFLPAHVPSRLRRLNSFFLLQ